MLVTVDSRKPVDAKVDLLALPMLQIDPADWSLPPRIGAIDRATGGSVSAAIESGDFLARTGQTLLL